MDQLIALFPAQLSESIKIGLSAVFSKPGKEISNVVISGLGGSGIGGTIVKNFATGRLGVPVVVNKTYDLPAFVSENSLVIICSYSGNTEETIEAFRQAIVKKAFTACMTSGGAIEEMANKHRLPCFKIPPGMPPRACLGYSVVQILFALHYAGLMDDSFVAEIEKSVLLLEREQETIRLLAADLATRSVDKLPVIYAGSQMEGVAVRWRQQLNENSKVSGWSNVVPEMNHNELAGWRDQQDNLGVFFLHAGSDHPKVSLRMGINKEIISRCTPFVYDINAKGDSYWEQVFYLIHIGDWLSWYYAERRQVDAMEVNVIDYLKSALSARQGS
ncbi:MAG TPA: bifunctional phosphoglucose/phosphomannose isomerase [Edaphocola sp.]|nr:bifunctional phosphoglucose/phosphomannose isomerase [Edaphocola sp.]